MESEVSLLNLGHYRMAQTLPKVAIWKYTFGIVLGKSHLGSIFKAILDLSQIIHPGQGI